MASQAFLDDQLDLKNAIAIGWSEDDCNGFKIVRIRVVDKHYKVKTKLMDLAVAAEKKAVRRLDFAEESIRKACHGSEADFRLFCSKVQAGLGNGATWAWDMVLHLMLHTNLDRCFAPTGKQLSWQLEP